MPCVCILWQGGVSCPVSVYYGRVGCHALCLYTMAGWGVMPCVCILWQGGVSCLVSVYYGRLGCQALCLYTMAGWGVMPCVCILWQGGVSCPVSVYYGRVGCHALCLYTMAGWGVMSCVCILWQGGVSCPVSVYYGRVGCHALCLYTMAGWGVMSCVCILWQGGCHVLCLYTTRKNPRKKIPIEILFIDSPRIQTQDRGDKLLMVPYDSCYREVCVCGILSPPSSPLAHWLVWCPLARWSLAVSCSQLVSFCLCQPGSRDSPLVNSELSSLSMQQWMDLRQ